MKIIPAIFILFLTFFFSCNTSPKSSNDIYNDSIKLDLGEKSKEQSRPNPLKFKTVSEVVNDVHSTTWVKISKDSPSSWLHFNLYNPDTLLIEFQSECWASFPIKISDKKIIVYWDNNIDTKYDFEIVKFMNKVPESFKGKEFIEFALANDSTLNVRYLFPKIISQLNKSYTDRVLFPDIFIATYQYLNNSEPSKDPCNFEKYFNSPTTPKLAKDIYADREWNLNNDTESLNLLDSLTAKDELSRAFYFKVVTKSEKKSDGYYSEGLGLTGKEYVQNHTSEFLDYFDNTECFDDRDLETWADIVLLEFSLAEENMYNKPFVEEYCKSLSKNCNCSSTQRRTLNKFSKILSKKWADYVKRMRAESKE